MSNTFVYVTYIRTTPERLWEALISPEFTRRYWMESWQESEWTPGAVWKMFGPDGEVKDAGEVLEFDPPKRLVLKWRNEFIPEAKAEGWSRCTYELESARESVKLTVTHAFEVDGVMLRGVSDGWPKILSSLKSLLEGGEALDVTRKWAVGA